ncbi:hypothetical protein MKK58_23460 [Methylobacterium sp. J-078]|uniref:hypothetical protein n=1 Tax=Methylobacterium sp. J-078 TaxID=2836657 RepID=UPI001FBBA864|nr:hypothetical protein [Methylobacterium sp. J-078]MCJ2047474.1 hypothetical protein [Methylobacterium sp. J-078]
MSIILTAGANRSGSTWLYNVVRLGLPSVIVGWVDDLPSSSDDHDTLVKLHEPHEGWAQRADIVLTCHRDLRDVFVSLRGMGWVTDAKAVETSIAVRSNHEYWSSRATLDLPYARIVTEPLAVVREVLDAINSSADAEEIARAVETIHVPAASGAFDATTLLHGGHRQSGVVGRYEQELDPDIADAIVAANAVWMADHGYL